VAITGGARGIGLAIARACSSAGMKVAIGDLAAEDARTAAATVGGSAYGAGVDVRDHGSFAEFLSGAEGRYGSLDVLVNNAGVLYPGPFAEADPQDVRRQLDVNLGGVLAGSRLALDRFVDRGDGHIVNVGSLAAMVPSPNGAVYSATKHAVLGFTRALRNELRGSGVRTTVVLPGVIRTQMTSDFRETLGVRTVGPESVGGAVVDALRRGTPEVHVPREVAFHGRLFTALPARLSDGLQRLTGADRTVR